MHDNCDGVISTGYDVISKVRQYGFSDTPAKVVHTLNCDCGHDFEMKTYETKCPNCNMVYAVTPCSIADKSNIKAVGINV